MNKHNILSAVGVLALTVLFNNCGQGFKALNFTDSSSLGGGTPTPRPSVTPIPTPTPQPSVTPIPTPTPQPSATPIPTATPQPSVTPIPTPRPSATPPPPPTPTPTPALRSLDVTWDAPTLNEDGSSASARGYIIRYGTSSGNYPSVISESTIGSANSYRIPSLTSGRTYYFIVVAVSTDGSMSNHSNELVHTIP